jgi:hypothetical protein
VLIDVKNKNCPEPKHPAEWPSLKPLNSQKDDRLPVPLKIACHKKYSARASSPPLLLALGVLKLYPEINNQPPAQAPIKALACYFFSPRIALTFCFHRVASGQMLDSIL